MVMNPRRDIRSNSNSSSALTRDVEMILRKFSTALHNENQEGWSISQNVWYLHLKFFKALSDDYNNTTTFKKNVTQ